MNRLFSFLTLLLLSTATLTAVAQTTPPQAFNFQAVATNNGSAVASSLIIVRVTIIGVTGTGTALYSETHNPTTDSKGAFAIAIGKGIPLNGNFANINWGGANHFLKIELDVNGSGTFVDMGTTQMLSVPYALYAGSAGNSGSTYTAGAGLQLSGTTFSALDESPTNELQNLSINGNDLSISGGNTVTLPAGQTYSAGAGLDLTGTTFSALDESPTNEIQTLSKTGNTISLSNGGGSVTDADAQTLSLTGATLAISGGNNVTLPDASATNEIQTLSKTGNTISLSNGGGSVTVTDAQTLSLTGATLAISGGNNVTLPDASATNEIQSLSISGNDLSISGGNTITIPSSGSQWVSSGNNISYTAGMVNIGSTNFGSGAGVGSGYEKLKVYQPVGSPGNQSDGVRFTGSDVECCGSLLILEHMSTGLNYGSGNTDTRGRIIGFLDYNSTLGNADYGIGIGEARNFFFGRRRNVYPIQDLSIGPNGYVGMDVSVPKAKLHVSNGDVYLDNSANGIIMKAPNGNCYRVTVSNTGTLVSTAITCP